MLNWVVSTNFGKKVPKMPILGHMDHDGAQYLFWSILAKLNMIWHLFLSIRRLIYTRHAYFIHLNLFLMSGPWCFTWYAFQKVLAFLLTQWPTPGARIITVRSCLIVNGLWLSVLLNVTNVIVSSNVLNWIEIRSLGTSRQMYFFSMSQQTRKNC